MSQRKSRIVKIKISAMPLILILRWSEVLATGKTRFYAEKVLGPLELLCPWVTEFPKSNSIEHNYTSLI